MEKGKGLMVDGRRWAVDFSDNSSSNSTRDITDPPGFTRASQDQDDSTLSRQKKDAESNWKAQVLLEILLFWSIRVFFSPSTWMLILRLLSLISHVSRWVVVLRLSPGVL